MKKICEELLKEFLEKNKGKTFKTDRIEFLGVEGYDVYNIAAPIEIDGENIIPGRVEKRDSEYSQIKFFKENKTTNKYELIEAAPTFNLQDPFYSYIDNELVLGGVEVFDHPTIPKALWYKTVFYKGKDIYDLVKIAEGPNGMKDIRVCQIKKDRIAVFTRPQGDIGGRGTIGYLEISNLQELTPEKIVNAELLTELFVSEEWGGVNEAHLLSNGKLGVLSHIAEFDEQGNRYYYPCYFIFDPETKEYTDMELLGYRGLFIKGESKRPDLENVVFSGGLKRKESGRAMMYFGISDAEAHWLETDDPFVKWEK